MSATVSPNVISINGRACMLASVGAQARIWGRRFDMGRGR